MTINSNTADRILDAAQELIQRRGYNAISFNDIAEQVGIKKPSIIHHFPCKAALGRAVIKRYREHLATKLDGVANADDKSAVDAFDVYCTPYTDLGTGSDKICLCGSLAGEFMALPKDMRNEVSIFFESHIKWLENILAQGKKTGEFIFDDPLPMMAQLILDSLQGALIVKRATANTHHLHNVIRTLKAKLNP